MTSKLVERGPGFARTLRALERMNDATVDVGVFADAGTYPDGTSVAEVATIHEFGAPAAGIPERSFIRSTLVEQKEAIGQEFARLAQQVLGKRMGVRTALNRYGEAVAELIKLKIQTGPFVPLAPETVKRKGHDTPLIDTDRLHDSITWRINGEGGDED